METREIKAFWCRLSEVLSRGKELAESLEYVVALPEIRSISEPLESIVAAVQGGTPFHQALRNQPSICTDTVATIVEVNEDAADFLAQAAKLLTDAMHQWWFPLEPWAKERPAELKWALQIFWRERELLMRTRVPLARALRCIERDLGGHELAESVHRMAGLVEDGEGLGGALDALPGVFSSRVTSLVKAAEAGEVLAQAIGWLVRDLERGDEEPCADEPEEPVEVTDRDRRERDRALFWCQFGRLLRCGTSVPEALLTAAGDSKDKGLIENVTLVADDIRAGAPLGDSMLKRGREFGRDEWERIIAGENAGALDRAALELAGRADELKDDPRDNGEDSDTVDHMLQEFILDDEQMRRGRAGRECIDVESLPELVKLPPVRKLLNLVLLQAIKDRASDVHFECYEDALNIRYRIDGILYEMVPPPVHLSLAIMSRLKVMADLDITERRRAQRGRVELNVNGRGVTLIVDTIPCVDGEHCAIRLCDETQTQADLFKVGLPPAAIATVKTWLDRPSGLVLVTGPAASGKTTTLYAMINELKRPSRSVVTVEDPIDGRIEGIAQVRINARRGFGWHEAIDAAMRRPCDVLVLGDLPDAESAAAACQAASQGRLVLASLAASDPSSAVRRLLDLERTPHLLASTLIGATGQRLVRKLCDCKQSVPTDVLSSVEREFLADSQTDSICVPRGCDRCSNVGYKGRIAIYELFAPNDALRSAIAKDATADEIRRLALGGATNALRETALENVKTRMTSLVEVMQALAS